MRVKGLWGQVPGGGVPPPLARRLSAAYGAVSREGRQHRADPAMKDPAMPSSLRAALLAGLALATAAASAPLQAQTAAPAAAAANPAIIPLPLQPVVPAAQRTCTARTASGLGYTELRPGTGPKAGATDYVLIGYIGYLAATGAVFDQNARAPMPVNGVIPGFGEGLQLIARGGVWRFCIPAKLGYGAEAAGPIPANSDLVFQVELFDSRTAAEVEAMQRAAPPEAPAAPPKP